MMDGFETLCSRRLCRLSCLCASAQEYLGISVSMGPKVVLAPSFAITLTYVHHRQLHCLPLTPGLYENPHHIRRPLTLALACG